MSFNPSLYRIRTNNLISILISFYWFIQVFFYSDTINRFVLLIPSIVLSGLIAYLLLSREHQKFQKGSYLLFAFLFSSVFTGIYNSELEIVAATTIFTLPLLAVNERLFTIDTRLVNLLFLATIIIGVISFHLGYNDYGYLPGHSYLNGLKPWWRVSIFPTSTPTVSSFFSLFVYLYNIRDHSFRGKVFRMASIYFLLLSGSRTAILLFGAIIVYKALKNKKRLKYLLPYIFLVAPLTILLSDFIFILSDNEVGQEYLLRGHSYQSEGELSSFSRFILWDNLLSLFWQSPIFGLGSFNLYEYYPSAPSHSESKWLSLLASRGVFTIFLVLFFAYKYYKAVKYNRDFEAWGALIVIITMFYYGSFYNAYHIIFFLNILLLSKE